MRLVPVFTSLLPEAAVARLLARALPHCRRLHDPGQSLTSLERAVDRTMSMSLHWPSKFLPELALDGAALRGHCEAIHRHCEVLGFALPAGCRVLHIVTCVMDFIRNQELAFDRSDKGAEVRLALQELSQLRLVVQVFRDRHHTQGYRQKAKTAFTKGTHLMQDDVQSSGRDTQFELWLAALSLQAGLPVELRPPPGADLFAMVGEDRVAVEAKRARKLSGACDDLDRACKQLAGTAPCTVLAVDLTEIMEAESGIISADDSEQAAYMQDRALRAMATEYVHAARTETHAVSELPVGILFTAITVGVCRFPRPTLCRLSNVSWWSLARNNDPRLKPFWGLATRLQETTS